MLILQCEVCKYFLKDNISKCEKYPDKKPSYILESTKECSKFKHINIMNIKPKNKKEAQVLGGIFGFCVADALGVPVEFTSREKRQSDPVKEMRAHGTYDQYFGTWSDDSSLTICLMDSLIRGYDLKDISDKFCKYSYEGYWTPYNQVFDIGNTTALAVERIKSGINPIECGGKSEIDNGNGSLTRVLPLAFYLQNKPVEERFQIIEDVSSLTHAHKRSKLACIIYVEFAINLIKGLEKQEAYKKTQEFILIKCKENYKDELLNFDRVLRNNIGLLEEKEIKSSGYVIDSLEAAIWSFMSSENYSEVILKAINLGEDTDTIGAIAGGLAGIFYGVENIPENWIQCLARKEDIYRLCKEFSVKLT